MASVKLQMQLICWIYVIILRKKLLLLLGCNHFPTLQHIYQDIDGLLVNSIFFHLDAGFAESIFLPPCIDRIAIAKCIDKPVKDEQNHSMWNSQEMCLWENDMPQRIQWSFSVKDWEHLHFWAMWNVLLFCWIDKIFLIVTDICLIIWGEMFYSYWYV